MFLRKIPGDGIVLNIDEQGGGKFWASILLYAKDRAFLLFDGGCDLGGALRKACKASHQQGYQGFYSIESNITPNGPSLFASAAAMTLTLAEIDTQLRGISQGLAALEARSSAVLRAYFREAGTHRRHLKEFKALLIERGTVSGQMWAIEPGERG